MNTDTLIQDFVDEYEFLRNDYKTPVLFGGMEYPTAEHCFQAAKTNDESIRCQILDSSTREARRIGRQIQLPSDWDCDKVDIMECILRSKFSESEMEDRLLDTGTKTIASSRDSFWGIENGSGENHLGKILMKIRKEKRLVSGEDGDGEKDEDIQEKLENKLLECGVDDELTGLIVELFSVVSDYVDDGTLGTNSIASARDDLVDYLTKVHAHDNNEDW